MDFKICLIRTCLTFLYLKDEGKNSFFKHMLFLNCKIVGFGIKRVEKYLSKFGIEGGNRQS